MEKTKRIKPSSKKLYLLVYDEIRQYIRDNNLQPGDRLPTEAEMCAIYGVSRNVLREAIKSLEITGVVSSKPGVGITIREVDASNFLSMLNTQLGGDDVEATVRNIEELRMVLEQGFDYRAFDTVTEADMDIMEEQIRIMEARDIEILQGQEDNMGILFAAADAKFHKVLFSRTGNQLLTMIIELFWAYDRYFQGKVRKPNVTITVEKHRAILNALRAHDYTAFHQAMLHHFSYCYKKSSPYSSIDGAGFHSK